METSFNSEFEKDYSLAYMYRILIWLIINKLSSIAEHAIHMNIILECSVDIVTFAILIIFLAGYTSIGTKKIKEAIEVTPAETDPRYIENLIRSMRFICVRKYAWSKLKEVLPLLPKNYALKVSTKSWRMLYKYIGSYSLSDQSIVFNTASLISDKRIIPYITRKIESKDIPEDIRLHLQGIIDSLKV